MRPWCKQYEAKTHQTSILKTRLHRKPVKEAHISHAKQSFDHTRVMQRGKGTETDSLKATVIMAGFKDAS